MAESSDVPKTIVDTVAEYEQCPPEILPSLEEKIDSETYRILTTGEGQPTEPLEFTYLWYQVTVLPTGDVVITA